MLNEWKFSFRENMPLFWAELIEYSSRDYISLAEGKEMSCYVKVGEKHKRIKNLVEQLKSNNEEIKTNNYTLDKTANILDILTVFKELIQALLKRSQVYNYTEPENFDEEIYSKDEIHEIAKLRFESKKLNKKNWIFMFDTLLEAISKKTKISVHDLRFLKYEEIINLDKIKPDLTKIEERKKTWGLIQENGKKRFLKKTEIMQFRKLLMDNSKNVLSGSGTFPGKIKGIAKVIKSMNNLGEIKKLLGKEELPNILVTPMTQPDIVMYIDSIGGIVTDEGGILCHAGILSREFQLPCVVGTGDATKKIKTGDIIEIDANNGTVTLIKKVKK